MSLLKFQKVRPQQKFESKSKKYLRLWNCRAPLTVVQLLHEALLEAFGGCLLALGVLWPRDEPHTIGILAVAPANALVPHFNAPGDVGAAKEAPRPEVHSNCSRVTGDDHSRIVGGSLVDLLEDGRD